MASRSVCLTRGFLPWPGAREPWCHLCSGQLLSVPRPAECRVGPAGPPGARPGGGHRLEDPDGGLSCGNERRGGRDAVPRGKSGAWRGLATDSGGKAGGRRWSGAGGVWEAVWSRCEVGEAAEAAVGVGRQGSGTGSVVRPFRLFLPWARPSARSHHRS